MDHILAKKLKSCNGSIQVHAVQEYNFILDSPTIDSTTKEKTIKNKK